jgi:hypothetical protein
LFRGGAKPDFVVITLKHKLDGRFLEKRSGENLENCVKGMGQCQFFFDNGDQDINGHSTPDLDLHTVGRGAEEALDTQVLFDPFKKQFDLPALTINRRDGQSREKEIISQKDEACVDFV